MKKSLLPVILVLFSLNTFSQLLSWTPNFIQESSDPVTITTDATKGNQGLLNYTPTSDVYVHIGVITNLSTSSSDWKHVKFSSFSTAYPAAQCTYLGSNKWSYTITGGLRSYFGVTDPTETIQKIAILFRNGAGTKKQANTDGSDMYIPVYTSALAVRFNVPLMQPTYNRQPETITKNIGDNISMTAVSNNPATLKLYFNGSVVATASGATTISANPSIVVGGTQTLIAEANDGTTTKTDTITFFVSGGVNVLPLPAGVRDGINYNSGTSVTLVLYAPTKTRVAVVGEFSGSNWMEQSAYEMNKTPDGNYWWVTINGLTAGNEYAYQYLVDGTLKIADPYTEKILDPSNDQYISSTTYPGLKSYPSGSTTGIVSILQTSPQAYNWAVNNFSRPDKRNLMIYELLARDFVGAHDWKTLRDTLNYIKRLGINTIEVMPFNEFEGNNSWGYNPDFYFAPDKYYGPANTLKEFIDSCHKNGMAVVMDMVLNHSFGSSPMVQLYWDAANNRPAANNPWFNPVAKHAFNVGYDMNHESLATRYFVSRVVEHWLTNYKIDGFRFDLSKGFTQTQTCDNTGNNCDVNAFGNYDASRVAIWKRYYDTLQLKSPGCYAILEHFAVNSEEIDLSNYGMMLWGNLNYNYNQASMGYNTDWDFSWGIFTQRGWTNPYLITYMESHDEERLMYKNLQFGNSSGSYNVKDLNTALKRVEMCGAFFFTIPGPKMVWQFGELGYDYSINTCSDGVTINNNCRTDQKPLRWDYLQVAPRKHVYDVYRALMRLRYNPLFTDAFVSNQITQDFSSAFKWLKVNGSTGKIMVVGNFGVSATTGAVTFQNAGTWYDYLDGSTITATGASQTLFLLPGEYHVYLNQNATLPVTLVNFSGKNNGINNVLSWTVANELNLSSYELQRSVDGQNFSSISSNNAIGRNNYSYIDDIAGSGSSIYYYRLKSIDKDGNFNYSAVVKLKMSTTVFSATALPNPFKENLKINVQSVVQDDAIIILTDLSGRQLIKQNIQLAPGNNAYDLKQGSDLSAGTYVLTIITSEQTQNIKVMKGN